MKYPKKAPKLSPEETQPKGHPYHTAEQDDLGRLHIMYHHPDKPDEGHEVHVGYSGSYKAEQAKDGGLHARVQAGHVRDYTEGGHSSHTDGSTEVAQNGNQSTVTKGDTGSQTGKDTYHGVGGNSVKAIKGSEFKHNTDGHTYQTTKGDTVSEHTGNIHRGNEGDVIDAVKGNKHTMVNKGEYGVHVQGGNMDMQTNQKLRMKSKSDALFDSDAKSDIKAKSDITITSDTKITLKVGGSKITITSSDITIESGGTVTIKGSGVIDIKGATTKVQGGGAAAPPTTFT